MPQLTDTLQLDDPDEFDKWEKLVRAAESLEGGLNRNSSPQSIAAARSVYDRFLAKFPLFFGYWKKYADLEFSIAGTESAEFVSLSPFRASTRGLADMTARYMSAESQVSPFPLTCGSITVVSRPKLATIQS